MEEAQEGTSSTPPSSVATCNVILAYEDSASSDSDGLFTAKEQEVLRMDAHQEEAQAEVNMNLRGGKVLPDPPKTKASKVDKHTKDSNPLEEIPEASRKKAGKQQDIDYNIIAHLKRIPALLSVYDALMLVLELREALVKALLDPELYEVAMAKH